MIEKANIILTHNCNLKCLHCYMDAKNCQEDYDKNYDIVRKLLIKLHNDKFKSVMFTGGECMLFPKLKELIIFAKSLDFRVSIFTNGMIYDEEIFNLIDSINISLDGPEEIHNYIRNNNKSYNNVIRILDYLKSIDKYTTLQLTINNYNYKNLDFIAPLVRDHLNVRTVKLAFVSSTGRAKKNNIYHNKEMIEYVYSKLDELYEKSKYHIQYITNLYSQYDFKNYCLKRKPVLPLWFDIPDNNFYVLDSGFFEPQDLNIYSNYTVKKQIDKIQKVLKDNKNYFLKNNYIDIESFLIDNMKGEK